MKKMNLILLSMILICASGAAQIKTLDREYVPAVYRTAAKPLFELNVNDWTAFRFDRKYESWTAIPFQFDQLTDTHRYDRNKDDIADATDEIILLPSDMGDKAELWHWINDDAAQKAERIEIEFTDPLDSTKQGWVYLFKNVTSINSVHSYLGYIPGPAGAPAADTIVTKAFKLGHNKNGWIDYLKFSNGLNNIVDRFKLRLKGKGILIPAYEINEDFVEASVADDAVSYFPGPVRSFHITKADILLEKLGLPLIPDRSTFEYNYEYTPYSFEIEAETDIDAGMLAIFGIKLIRQSLDFNSHADGMMFYSAANPDGVLIDGVPTTFSDALDQSQEQNWVMASGDDGAVFLIFDLTLMRNSTRRIYFRDQKENSWTGDETHNTGDQFSYGDMGVMIEATGSALITERLTVSFKGYFIDKPNVTAEYGKQLLAWEQNPLKVAASSQNYEPAVLVQHDNSTPMALPMVFQLYSAYPNPYSMASQKGLNIEFSGRMDDSYNLVIYNIMGRQVAEFRNLAVNENGRYVLTWDARDTNGLPLMPGVYFYQLQNGAMLHTQKLVISR